MKFTKQKNIKLTKEQNETLDKLKYVYSINVNEFVRLAIAEKLKRDYKMIKERKQKESKCPF